MLILIISPLYELGILILLDASFHTCKFYFALNVYIFNFIAFDFIFVDSSSKQLYGSCLLNSFRLSAFLISMPTMESESSIASRAEELKCLANEAFKGTVF